jgi:flagellar biosynthesis chaperone FliJ
MNFAELKIQFAQSASLRLMRADAAPFVLAVLFSAFKQQHMPTVSETRLRAILEVEIEELRDGGEIVTEKGAKDYLAEWSDQAHGYLRRHHPDGEDEPVFELTPEVERVFQWLETLQPKTHIGTESKFKTLAAVLEELVLNSTREPDVRIKQLKEEQTDLQQQIDEIERTGKVTVYNATQVNERFAAVLETARKLLGDFREVERHFRRVTENISVQQSSIGSTRGDIVGQTLDAQERLRESSQGQSFYAFWDFLLAPDRRREFTELVEQAYSLPILVDELKSDVLLRRLQSSLRAEGNKVVASNERLVAQLRRVLDVRESAERREVGRMIQEIKSLAHQTREMLPQTELLEVDVNITVASLMSKSTWAPPENVDFGGSLEISDGGDYRKTLEDFLRLHPVDLERLRRNIQSSLQTRVQITLPELLELFPPRNGILEVLAYLLIAESDGPHVVLDAFDVIDIPEQHERRFQVPQIVFSNT